MIWYLLVAAYAIKTGDIPKIYKTKQEGYKFTAYDFDIDHLETKDIRSLLRRIDKWLKQSAAFLVLVFLYG